MTMLLSPIVVADDDAVGRELVSRILEKAGHSTVSAADGAHAWELIQSVKPPLAVLDWDMPHLTGLDVVRRIKLTVDRTPPYVLLLTSRTEVRDRVRGLTGGADDYLTKPFEPAELVARVQVGLRVVQLQRSLSARVAELEHALAHVNRLEQLLPICAHCKRIQSGEDWHDLEGFLASSTGVRFSHGACPACAGEWLDEEGFKASGG
jgi:sigma-B regulation protein RsbU (phosphoserine phosphatase)